RRFDKLFMVPQGGPRPLRAVAILAGSVGTYLGVVALAFGFFRATGVPTRTIECTVEEVVEGYPAYGKLEPGDRLVALDGMQVTVWPSLMIDQRNGAPVRLTVERGSTTRDVTLQPIGKDGHWVVGFRPRLETRSRDAGLAIGRAFAFPIRRAIELIPN